jgi:hypothetical protein
MKTEYGNIGYPESFCDLTVIVHACHCSRLNYCRISRQIRKVFPTAHLADLHARAEGIPTAGSISYATGFNPKNQQIIIVNAHLQVDVPGSLNQISIDEQALTQTLKTVLHQFPNQRIGFLKPDTEIVQNIYLI